MSLAWLSWSSPVAIWWVFLISVSAANIALWLRLRALLGKPPLWHTEPLALLSAGYVFGCAFRSILPRADVQRICLFDTWLSSVLIGRSVATIAELCFVIQWAIVLRQLAQLTRSDTASNIAKLIVPLIVLAECCSWYAVLTTDFLGNVLENSLWTVTFILIALALGRLMLSFYGVVRWTIAGTIAGIAGYVVFMSSVDVPMYVDRWQTQLTQGHHFLGLVAGLHDVATRWVVTHSFTPWHHEIPWMSLYFSMAVWTSLLLGGFSLVKDHLPRYRVRRPLLKQTRRSLALPSA